MSRLSQLVNDYTPLTFWTWPTRKLAGEPSYERSNHVEHRRTQWSILDIISLITCLSPVVLFCRKAPNYAIVGPASCGACAGCVRLWLNIILSHELNALRSCDAWLMTTREYARARAEQFCSFINDHCAIKSLTPIFRNIIIFVSTIAEFAF